MNSLANNIHVLHNNPRAERLVRDTAEPLTLAGAVACLFSASGRERLAAETGGDKSDTAYAWGL